MAKPADYESVLTRCAGELGEIARNNADIRDFAVRVADHAKRMCQLNGEMPVFMGSNAITTHDAVVKYIEQITIVIRVLIAWTMPRTPSDILVALVQDFTRVTDADSSAGLASVVEQFLCRGKEPNRIVFKIYYNDSDRGVVRFPYETGLLTGLVGFATSEKLQGIADVSMFERYRDDAMFAASRRRGCTFRMAEIVAFYDPNAK